MKKIELPATMEMRRKVLIQEELTKTEQLICLLANPDTDVAVLEALQEAYNQGYEDGRKSEVDHMKAIKDIEGLI